MIYNLNRDLEQDCNKMQINNETNSKLAHVNYNVFLLIFNCALFCLIFVFFCFPLPVSCDI